MGVEQEEVRVDLFMKVVIIYVIVNGLLRVQKHILLISQEVVEEMVVVQDVVEDLVISLEL